MKSKHIKQTIGLTLITLMLIAPVVDLAINKNWIGVLIFLGIYSFGWFLGWLMED